jgi:hypothetical protein
MSTQDYLGHNELNEYGLHLCGIESYQALLVVCYLTRVVCVMHSYHTLHTSILEYGNNANPCYYLFLLLTVQRAVHHWLWDSRKEATHVLKLQVEGIKASSGPRG